MTSDAETPPAPEQTPQPDGELRRLSALTPLARSGVFFVVAAFAVGRQVVEEGEWQWIAGSIVGVIALGAVWGTASWYRTFFRITPTELRIDTGVVSRRSRRVRLDRILEIGVRQPLVARVLGLAELKIETATNDSEVSLAYLQEPEAREVRRTLLEGRDRRRAEESGEHPADPQGATAATGSTSHPPAEAEPRLLVRVPIAWQAVGVLLGPETIGLVLLLATAGVLLLLGVPFASFGVGLISILGAAISVARKVSGWWDWTVSAVPTGLQVKHGLFDLSTRTFNVERLQGVRITEPLLHRPFGLARLDLSVAGGGIKDSGEDNATGIAVPVAPKALVWRLATDLIGADPAQVPLTIPPTRARWLDPIARRWLGFGMNEQVVVSRTGWLSRRTDVVPLARVQSFRATQGPVERRLRLATVHADTPVGLVSISGLHRDPTEARELVTSGVDRARAARALHGSAPQSWSALTDAETARPPQQREPL